MRVLEAGVYTDYRSFQEYFIIIYVISIIVNVTFDSFSLEECDVSYPDHMLFPPKRFLCGGRSTVFVVVIVVFVDAVGVHHLQ